MILFPVFAQSMATFGAYLTEPLPPYPPSKGEAVSHHLGLRLDGLAPACTAPGHACVGCFSGLWP